MLKLRLPVPRLVSSGDVFFERGSVGVLRALPATRVAVIASSSFWKNTDGAEAVVKALGKADHRVFHPPSGEPEIARLAPLLAQINDYRPDWFVAIGGGSVMDSAKILWALFEHPDLDLERALRPGGMPPLRGKARLACIPTTSGTGSEVSSAAVFLDPQSGSKRALVSHDFLPDLAILDPDLARFTPPAIAAASGMDALAHAVEGYVSRFPNAFLERQSELAAEMVFRSLENAVRKPDDGAARTEMMSAALIAGWIQNARIPGLGHALAHQMSPFGLSHGHACAIFLPVAIQINSETPAVRERYDVLAARLNLGGAPDLASRCRTLMESVGLEPKLSVAAPKALRASDRVIHGALVDVCAKANPTVLTESLLRAALEAAK